MGNWRGQTKNYRQNLAWNIGSEFRFCCEGNTWVYYSLFLNHYSAKKKSMESLNFGEVKFFLQLDHLKIFVYINKKYFIHISRQFKSKKTWLFESSNYKFTPIQI